MSAIVTFAEQRDGRLRRPSLEAVCEARRLVEALGGGQVVCVLIGSGVSGLTEELAGYGADVVHVFDDAALGAYASQPYARALAQVASQVAPAAVLIPFSATGKDLAPRVAARLGSGLVSDCVAFAVKEGQLQARRPMYAGKTLATVAWTSGIPLATLRPNVFSLAAPQPGRKAEVVRGQIDAVGQARVTRVETRAAGKLELTEAQVIVSGGRGLKGPEHFHLVEELAAAMGAAVGASRAVVDAGWVDHHIQVGQTGKTVSPTLYIACGISGAIQHLAGMSSSRIIVAINKDADAPIFKVANYGILGDLFEVLPKLSEAARAHFAAKG